MVAGPPHLHLFDPSSTSPFVVLGFETPRERAFVNCNHFTFDCTTFGPSHSF